jgi:hypothetical protein
LLVIINVFRNESTDCQGDGQCTIFPRIFLIHFLQNV